MNYDPRQIDRMLARVGFYDLYDNEKTGISPLETAPPQGFQIQSKPSRSDPRLKALRDLYANFDCPALRHTQWIESLVDEIPFDSFRAESPYLWQLKDGNLPVSYAATYYYLKSSAHSDLLELCQEDDAFGASGTLVDRSFVTRDRVDSVSELGFLRDAFGLSLESEFTILDIGGGYGRLAWRISQCFERASVICCDAIPESTFLCDYYLNFRGARKNINSIPLPKLTDSPLINNVDLAVAVNSLSECSAEAISWWIDLISDLAIPYLFIVPHAAVDGGRQILTREFSSDVRADLKSILHQHGFVQKLLSPKYPDPALQKWGVSPTHFHLFELA